MSNFHTLTIKNITRETTKAISIEFIIPNNLQEAYKFTAGQYVTLKTTIEGKEIRRAYSICSAVNEKLCIAIKEIESGIFSTYANTSLKAGDVIEVHTPEGNFKLATNITANNTYCAFAAGSGITPIMSMVKTVLKQEPSSKFVLVYGNTSSDQTIFLQELLELQSTYSDRFFIELFYSRNNEEGAHFGRIEKSTINYILKNKFKDTSFKNFYLCGPEEMIHTVTDVLLENEIEKNNIHFELFTTNSSTTTEINENLEGTANITIVVDNEECTFVMDQGNTILDAAIDKDIDVPYSCQGGVCSSCICKITEGNAIMEKNNILTDGEIAEGLILACQAHPTSSVIKVDFDDV